MGVINLLPATERTLLLDTWNRTEAAYPDQCIHQLFEQQVIKTPEATALVYENQSLTYAELNTQANRLAHHLIAQGVRSDARIALCLERSFAMVIGLLAILKAGGAYVPLDPGYPSERLAYILHDTDPLLLLTDAAGRQALAKSSIPKIRVLNLDAANPLWSALPDTNPQVLPDIKPTHLAYVIYTSGSTGIPKGVMVEHRGVVNRLTWMQNTYSLNDTDVVLQKTSFSFDVSIWEFFWTLLNGATLALAAPKAHKDARYLIELIIKQQITTVHFVPSMLSSLIETEGVKRCTSLQRLICSGEILSAINVRKCQQALPGATLYNLYGPTETTIDSTAWSCPAGFDADTVPIGRPIANTRIYLLDAYGQPVPLGAVGELYIGGAGVARGYLNRLDLTAERFLSDPFSPAPNARMYRTGDLARYLPDGNLEFLGRNDEQIKLRGFRIEPGEIEARLTEHSDVHEAVITAREDSAGNKRLVAYLTLAQKNLEDPARLAEILRNYLVNRLPDYMVPDVYVILDTLPLTPSGKLDRRALPAPAVDAYPRQQYEAPQGEIEITLATLWAKLLGIERISRYDNFFALGGHSLLAVQLVNRLQQTLGVALSLSTLFASPTLAALAQNIRDEQGHAGPQALPPISHRTDTSYPNQCITTKTLPITQVVLDSERRLWQVMQKHPQRSAYNNALVFDIQGALDQDRLMASCAQVIAKLPTLNHAYSWQNQTLTRVHSQARPKLIRKNYATLSFPDQALLLNKVKEAFFNEPFDLECGPLIRIALITLSLHHHQLLCCAPHVVCDGLALDAFFRLVTHAYQRGLEDVQQIYIQPKDSVARKQTAIQFWQNVFATPLPPIDWPRQTKCSKRLAKTLTLEGNTLDNLIFAAKREQVSLPIMMLTLWNCLLYRFGLGNDRCLAVPVANRDEIHHQNLMVNLSNTLPLRCPIDKRQLFKDYLRTMAAHCMAALAYQSVSIDQVLSEIADLSLNENLFDLIFSYMDFALGSLRLGDTDITGDFYFPHDAKAPLVLSVIRKPDNRHVLHLEAQAAYFSETFIDSLLACYHAAINQIAHNVHCSIQSLAILPPEQQQLIAKNLQPTGVLDPSSIRTLTQALITACQRYADRPAILDQDASISYQVVWEQACRIAVGLKMRGISAKTGVGIAMPKGVPLIIAILGVLLNGCYYVPLDLRNPCACNNMIIEDAGIEFAICETALDLSIQQLNFKDFNACNSGLFEPLAVSPNDLAYVMYTSGTTGKPKGVTVTQFNVASLFQATQNLAQFNEHDVWTLFHSYAFDFSVWEIFGALIYGGKLIIVPEKKVANTEWVVDLINQHQVSVFNQTPTAFKNLLQHVDKLIHLPRLIIFGGEALNVNALKVWWQRFGEDATQFINMYGITEITVHATYHKISSKAEGSNIGIPLADMSVVVIDENQAICPVGVAGELWVSGHRLSPGYLNRPDLNEEKFISQRLLGLPPQRFYRSGDRATLCADGSFEYLSRLDQQLKLNGIRIEKEAILTALKSYPGVQNAEIKLLNEDELQLLAAYYQSPNPIDEESLYKHLAQVLPTYALPSYWVHIKIFPLTVNGKINLSALPNPLGNTESSPPAAKLCDIEARLLSCWRHTLGIDKLMRNIGFFEQGGSSMKAALLVSHVNQQFGPRTFSLIDVFRYATIAEQIACIKTRMAQQAQEVI